MLTLKEDSKKKRFYEVYGKHVLLIEIALILISLFTFVVMVFPVPAIVAFGAWLIVTFVISPIHLRIYSRIVRMELYPYEILRLERVRSRFNKTLVYFFFLLLILSFLTSLFSTEIPPETYDIFGEIVGYVFFVIFPMLMVTFVITFGSINHHRKARLSFKTVLHAMEALREEKRKDEKMKLIKKYVKWFRDGLHAYNSYLYENIACLEIVDIEQYHRNIHNAALMGNESEIDETIEQIESTLNSLGKEGEDDLRHFLIALKNIKNGKAEKEYPLYELNEMTTIMSFSERVKETLKSPYVPLLYIIVTIILGLLRLIWK